MSDNKRRDRGLEKFNEVYCGDLPAPPAGALDFFDNMLEQLFGEVWARPQLSQRDRRLITMGCIAALGEREAFAIHGCLPRCWRCRAKSSSLMRSMKRRSHCDSDRKTRNESAPVPIPP